LSSIQTPKDPYIARQRRDNSSNFSKTVGNHVEHIYAKIGASARAQASLFAMQQGLLPEEELVPAPAT